MSLQGKHARTRLCPEAGGSFAKLRVPSLDLGSPGCTRLQAPALAQLQKQGLAK